MELPAAYNVMYERYLADSHAPRSVALPGITFHVWSEHVVSER